MPSLKIARIYNNTDLGYRILVDRIWPRGVSKEKANLNYWAKEIAPTAELRKWFNHDNVKFPEFRQRYIQELEANNDTKEFISLVKTKLTANDVILLFSTKNIDHNQAIVLQEYIQKELD